MEDAMTERFVRVEERSEDGERRRERGEEEAGRGVSGSS